ncbi:MAG: type II CAAX endopeptidase family protein [Candidatus Pacebacteria bacterium]|nr:type II CAAX endopeptidase family protein [Candidatus Paceibacterota bacterium]
MNKKIYQALGLCFLLSWGLAGVSKFSGIEYKGSNGLILAVLYMLMPAISVIILSKFFWKEDLKKWGLSRPKLPWFVIAWVFPIVIAFCVIPVSTLFPGIIFSPGMEGILAKYSGSPEQLKMMKEQLSAIGAYMPLIVLVQSLVAGITINAIAALGEEYLWRGLLLKEMKKYGWIKSSIFIGVVWGLWHAPLIIQGHNYPEHPYLGVLMMIVWCTLLTPLFIYFTARSKSVLTAAVMHGTLNASAGIGVMYTIGGNDLTAGLTGLAGFIVLVIADIVLIIADTRSKEKINDLLNEY